MEIEICFSQSAFKHGKTKADILMAFDTKQLDAEIDEAGYRDKYLLIGFDESANPIEVKI